MMFYKTSKKVVPTTECDICYEQQASDIVKTCGNESCSFKVCKTCGKEHVRIKKANICPACQQKIRHNSFVVNRCRVVNEGEVVEKSCCIKFSESCYDYLCQEPGCCIKAEPGRSAGITRYTCCFGYCVTEVSDCLVMCVEDYAIALCCTATTIGCCFAIKGFGFWLVAKGSVGNTTTGRIFGGPALMCMGEFVVGLFGITGVAIGGFLSVCLGSGIYDCSKQTGKCLKKEAIHRKQQCQQVTSRCMNRYWEGMTT